MTGLASVLGVFRIRLLSLEVEGLLLGGELELLEEEAEEDHGEVEEEVHRISGCRLAQRSLITRTSRPALRRLGDGRPLRSLQPILRSSSRSQVVGIRISGNRRS